MFDATHKTTPFIVHRNESGTMKLLKIGVVQEKIANALSTINMAGDLGYTYCPPATDYKGALEMLQHENPDLLLLDIQLTGPKDGIDVAQKINEVYHIPFIFLAAQTNEKIINRVKTVNPHAYIMWPFTKEELFAAIEIAFSNFTNNHPETKSDEPILWHARDFMFVKDGYTYHKVYFKDIIYLESDANYVTIHLQSKHKVMIRSTLKDFTARARQNSFVQVHRGYSVNINKIEDVFSTKIIVEGHEIPIGKSYKKPLYSLLGITSN